MSIATAPSQRRAATRGRRPTAGRPRAWTAALYVAITVIAASVALPLLWIVKVSLVTPVEQAQVPPTILPHTFTFAHYSAVFHDPLFIRSLFNSLRIAGLTTLITVALGTLAAYSLARLKLRYSGAILAAILAVSFFPAVSAIAPLFIEFRNLHMLDTYWAVVAVDTAFSLPLCVWILLTFFRQLPADLEDAARIDGASTLQTLRKVMFPLAAPGVATAAILTFIIVWNEYLFANTFLFNQGQWPVTVLIPNFTANQFTPDYGAQAAASLVVTVPMAVLVLLFQRRIVAGLTAGAVNG